MDYSEIFITNSVISGLIALIAKVIIRNSIKHEYDKKLKDHTALIDKDLANHKIYLKLETDSEIEKLKSHLKEESDRKLEEFKLDLTKEHIKFTSLHEKRCEVIEHIYSHLKKVHDHISFVLSGNVDKLKSSQKTKKKEEINKSFSDFQKYLSEKLIYLPSELGQTIRNLLYQLNNIGMNYVINKDDVQAELSFQTDVQEGIKNIEAELRKLLGYED